MKSSAVPKSQPGIDADIALMDYDNRQTVPSGQRTGMVLRVERSSIHDGDGFRTVVFLKGCPLLCQWCSTPESQSGAVQRFGDKIYGERTDVERIMREVRKDSIFFFHSGGGLTISGGEPLVQADFTAALLEQAQQECINTALETCLAVPYNQVEKVLPYLDTMYADLKHVDSEKHREYCATGNETILENIRRVDARAGEFRLIIRYPLVPGINDDELTLHRTGVFLAELDHLACVQVLPYHRLGVETYRKMGIEYPLSAVRAPDQDHVRICRDILANYVEGRAC